MLQQIQAAVGQLVSAIKGAAQQVNTNRMAAAGSSGSGGGSSGGGGGGGAGGSGKPMNIPPPPSQGWKLVRDMVADTVGPMAILAIAAQKFIAASAGAALNAQRMQEALSASDGAEKLRMQFEQLMGSSRAAAAQVEMLAKVAAGGAFSMDSLADASKNLQVLSDGALAGESALKKVQDVAAATGTPVDAMAASVAGLYAALKEGSGVGQAAAQLQQMGAISKETAKNVEQLSAAGVALSTSWQAVEGDLKKASGAASALGGTISGLQQQLAALEAQGNTKIGDMMLEGEKAGYRAAIGFQKFKNAVEEANAGPWSAFNSAINSAKESIGNFMAAVAGTGAVQGVFETMAKAAIAALVGLNIALLALIPTLLKMAAAAGGSAVAALGRMAAAAGISTAALGKMAVALRTLAFNPLTVGLTVAAGLMVDLAGRAIQASQSVQALQDTMKGFAQERDSATGKTFAEVGSARTPEERDAAEKNIRTRLSESQSRVTQNKAVIAQSEEILNSKTLGVSNYSIPERNAAESRKKIAEDSNKTEGMTQGVLSGQLEVLSGKAVGYDRERLSIAQKRLELEQQIVKTAQEALQRSASPEAAEKDATANREKAQREFDAAETAASSRYEEKKTLATKSTEFQNQVAARDTVSGQQSENKKLLEEFKQAAPDLLGDKEPAFYAIGDKVDRARSQASLKEGKIDSFTESVLRDNGISEEKIAAFRENQQAVSQAGGAKPLDFSIFETGAKTEGGKLQSEIAKRQALQAEERDALDKKDFGRVEEVRSRMSELVNPLTGKSELEGNKEVERLKAEKAAAQKAGDVAGAKGIENAIGQIASTSMGVSDQRLQTELKTAEAKEDPVQKRAALEAAKIAEQASRVARAAADAEINAADRRLAIEKQISALKGGGEKAEKVAIRQEMLDTTGEIDRKSAALQQFEPARAKYNELLNRPEAQTLGDPKLDSPAQAKFRGELATARANFEKAEQQAAAQGVDLGTDTQAGFKVQREAAVEKSRQQEQALAERSASREGSLRQNRQDAARSRAGRDDSAGERAAGVASEGAAKISNILVAEQAAKEYDAAFQKASAAKLTADPKKDTPEQAKVRSETQAAMNQAKVAQAATGYGGMGLEEINQIKSTETQILQLKLQQASVDQAAATARKSAAMDEVRFQQARNQITAANALGKSAGRTEFDIQEAELKNEKQKADAALPMAQEKEALTMKAEAQNAAADVLENAKGDPAKIEQGLSKLPSELQQAVRPLLAQDAKSLRSQSETDIAKRDSLEAGMAKLGFKGASADDIEAKSVGLGSDLKTLQTNRAASKQDALGQAKLEMARVAEEYAPTKESFQKATSKRKDLEDDEMRKESIKKYESQGFRGKEAENLAEGDVKINRLRKDLDEAGNIPVDDLTRVGGNASKLGLLPSSQQDKQEQLRQEVEKQTAKLDSILSINKQALDLGKAEDRKGK